MAFYVDTSALVKLVVEEQESAALRGWLSRPNLTLVTSDLARTELMRAVRRGAPASATLARDVLETLHLLHLTPAVLEDAGRLNPADLRSLDAIHLAAALSLGDDLEALVTYDDRQAQAAHALGVATAAPAPG